MSAVSDSAALGSDVFGGVGVWVAIVLGSCLGAGAWKKGSGSCPFCLGDTQTELHDSLPPATPTLKS